MLVMSPHEIVSLYAAVTGTVDGDTYDPNDLCDGDPKNPIRTPTGSADFTAVCLSTLAGVNGLVVANSNLDEGTDVIFSAGASGIVVMPRVPPSLIRKNGFLLLDPTQSVSGFRLQISGHSTPVEIGEALVGIFREIRTLPPASNLQLLPSFELPDTGEYGGLGGDKGAEARAYGGTVLLDDDEKEFCDDWFGATRNNSRPSVIVPFPDVNDAWLVKWVTYVPRPFQPAESGQLGIWQVDVAWQELPRYRWPA